MKDILEFIKNYKQNKELKIKFIDKFEKEKIALYKTGVINKYSENCFVIIIFMFI